MIKEIIEIDGQKVPFKASAAIPRIYRIKFRRDIYRDLHHLEKSIGENDENNSMTKTILTLIWYRLKYSRTLPISWLNTQTLPYRTRPKSGSIGFPHFQFIRFYRR